MEAIYPKDVIEINEKVLIKENENLKNLNYSSNTPETNKNQKEVDTSNEDILEPFLDAKVRKAFIKKVYIILTCQLSVTLVFIAIFLFVPPVRNFIQNPRNIWIYYTAYAMFVVTYLILICCPSVRRSYPGNYICLAIFTFAMSFMTAIISSHHKTYIVMIAISITAVVCVGITLFAIQTKIDFTLCSGLLFVLSLVTIVFGIAVMITFLITGSSFAAKVMQTVYGGICALVFSLYLIFDTQMLFGNHSLKISPEEYIYGALELYLDVIQIFLAILNISAFSRG